MTAHAMLAWLVVATPAVPLMTLTLTADAAPDSGHRGGGNRRLKLIYFPAYGSGTGLALSSHAV